MALDFPPNPTLDQIYISDSGRSWQWNGTAWDVYSTTSANVVNFLNGLTGGVTLSAGTGITLSPSGNILTISSTESGISGPYVFSIRGLTGAVGITNGSGIGLSVSGNTLNISNAGVLSFNGFTGAVQGVSAALGTTFLSVSSATGSVTFTNLGVQTFNGLTGTVTGVTLGGAAFTGLVSSTVGFSGPGTNITGVVTSFNNQTGAVTGVTLGGAAFTGLVSSTVGFSGPGTNITGVVTSFNNQTGAVQGVSTFNGLTGSIGFSAGTGITLTQSGNTFTIVATGVSGVSSVTGSGTGISVSPTTGAVVVQNTGVISFNGLTGTVTGVASATGGSGILITPSGGTGNITVTNTGVTGIQGGTGISVSSTTGNPIITNTGVQLFNGLTGSVTGVTLGGAAFTGLVSSTVGFSGPGTNITGVVTSFNNQTGAVIGVTVGGTNVFTALNSFNAGISADGGTFANDIVVNSMTIGRGKANLASNIAIGASAYFSGTTGVNNVAIGSNALRLNQAGDVNTAIGAGALQSNVNGRNNVALGAYALNALNTTIWSTASQAEYNVAIGGNALGNATTASYNIAIGAAAAQNITTGGTNVSIGTYTSLRNGAGNDNVVIGHQAMLGSGALVSPSYNTCLGSNSFFSMTNANYNVGIGHGVAFSSTSGNFNSVIGTFALYHATTLANSIAIGYEAGRFAGITGGSTLGSSTNSIYIGTNSKSGFATSSNEIVVGVNAVGLGNNTTVIGTTSATSATIYGTLNAPSGISAAGITVGGSIILQNSEVIKNTTNGRIDFMPGPTGTTAYGLYVDTTLWGSGVKLGTIRSSDNALNAAGILFDTSINIADDVDLSLTSNNTKTISTRNSGSSSGMFLGIYNSATDNGAVYITQNNMRGDAKRFSQIALPDPNLYIFARGNSSANDFIRFEHNSLNGRIVSGGTSGIRLEPGSGILGISGGISAAGGTFTGHIVLSGTTATAQIKFADGSTQDSSYKQHLAGPIIRDSAGDIIINPHGMITNTLPSVTDLGPTGPGYMLLLNDFYIPRGCTVTRIVTRQGDPTAGHTGQIMFALYDVNFKTGLPNNLLYASATQNLTKNNYQIYSAVPNVNIPAGSYWAGYLMDRTGVTQTMSWASISSRAFTWEAFSNGSRFYNNGNMASIRYRLSGFTLSSQLTAGFTSALAYGNTTGPAIGFGCSENMSSKSPWTGISVEL